MSAVVKKCPKDGIVYDPTFAGTCASCFGPLKFFCKTHNEWLNDAHCPKCDGQSSPAAAPLPATPAAGPSIVGVLAVLAICVGLLVACGWLLYRKVVQKPAVATAAPPKAVPPPQPSKASAPPAVVTLSLSQLFADPDQHVGKIVAVAGTIQFRDAGKETFDLRQGDHILSVQYRGIPSSMKTTVAGASVGKTLAATGILQRDDSDNSYYLIAQSVAGP